MRVVSTSIRCFGEQRRLSPCAAMHWAMSVGLRMPCKRPRKLITALARAPSVAAAVRSEVQRGSDARPSFHEAVRRFQASLLRDAFTRAR